MNFSVKFPKVILINLITIKINTGFQQLSLTLPKFLFLFIMWKYTNTDGEVITGNREQIALYLNIQDDVYDDDVWDKIVEEFKIQPTDNQ